MDLLTEKRMQVLSWYTALGPAVGSRCFSTLPLSPVRTDCSSIVDQSPDVRHTGLARLARRPLAGGSKAQKLC